MNLLEPLPNEIDFENDSIQSFFDAPLYSENHQDSHDKKGPDSQKIADGDRPIELHVVPS